MKRRTLTVSAFLFWPILLLCNTSIVHAQDPPEYGDFSELRGLRKVYINSPDFETRKMVIKEIEEQVGKKKIDLEVVSVPEDADMHVIYESQVTGQGIYATQHAQLAVAIRGKQIEGATVGLVGTQRYRYRIVFSAKSQRGLSWQRNPIKKALQRFLKDLSKLQKAKTTMLDERFRYGGGRDFLGGGAWGSHEHSIELTKE